MRRFIRFMTALAVCLSGWVVVPFAALPSKVFGWEEYAGAYSLIFEDGFESGDLSQWTRIIPAPPFLRFHDVEDGGFYQTGLRLDREALRPLKSRPAEVLVGHSRHDVPLFVVEAADRSDGLRVRARARRDNGSWVESPWRRVRSDYRALELEWRKALEETEDGALFLAVDGRLLLWLVDLDNDREELGAIGLAEIEGQPLVRRADG